MPKPSETDWGPVVVVCVWLICMTFLLSGCDMTPSPKRAVAKIAGVEATSVGFGGGTASVYRLVADDHSTCRVSPGFYATVQLPARVTCYWDNQ